MASHYHRYSKDGTQYKDYTVTSKYNPDTLFDVDVLDTEHPQSMVNLVPTWLAKRMLSEGMKHYISMSEDELEAMVRPNVTLKRLRSSFWYEFERIHRNYGRWPTKRENNIGIFRICNGVCTTQYFMDKISRNDLYLAWIIRPPLNYEKAMNEALEHGISRLREILNLPLYQTRLDRHGMPVVDSATQEVVQEPNDKIANIILKTVAFLDLRIKGSVPQRIHQITQSQIESKQITMNITKDDNVAKTPIDVDFKEIDEKLLTIDDLDKRIAQLSSETEELIDSPKFNQAERGIVIQDEMDGMDKHIRMIEDGNKGNSSKESGVGEEVAAGGVIAEEKGDAE